jgi:hypothetical protein
MKNWLQKVILETILTKTLIMKKANRIFNLIIQCSLYKTKSKNHFTAIKIDKY